MSEKIDWSKPVHIIPEFNKSPNTILEDCPFTACAGKQLQAQLTTANERIKKMSKGDLGPESIISGYGVLVKSLEKRRDELRDGLTTAKEENKRLKEFARHVIKVECWAVDGADIQDMAEKSGLIVPHTATKEDVDDESDFVVGDTIFKFSKTLKENKP